MNKKYNKKLAEWRHLQEIGEKKAREIRLDSEEKIEMDIWDKKFYGGTEHLKDVFRVPHEDFGDFVDCLKSGKPKEMFDLGCGTGRHTIALVKEGFEVDGIDISRKCVRRFANKD